MVFYEFGISYTLNEEAVKKEKESRTRDFTEREDWERFVMGINDQLGIECGLDGNISLLIVDGREGYLSVVAGCKLENVSVKKCKDYIHDTIAAASRLFEEVNVTSEREICPTDVKSLVAKGSHTGIYRGRGWFCDELNINSYTSTREFSVKEKCVGKKLSYKQAIKRANEILADDTLLEELDRIYSKENPKKYYGNPVHYKLVVGTFKAAVDIYELLVMALVSNKRLPGTRVDLLSSLGGRYDIDEELDSLFSVSQGNVVAIDMSGNDGMQGNYASEYESIANDLTDVIKRYGLYTLCIFIENTSNPGFSNNLVSKVEDNIAIVEIKEGSGDYERAFNLFAKLAKDNNCVATKADFDNTIKKKKNYTVAEVYTGFKKWYGAGLRERVYTSYRTCSLVNYEYKKPASEAYDELQDMVGLTEIKSLVDQIIDSGKMKKKREQMGIKTHSVSMHMIFTGNPGSAKTSVARLLAQILKKEGVLETGDYVEVGRADLIARYVGWTAKTVRQKFKEAKGGILFIDEAYSLVDDSNSFGDEAINTIVQEMENHRDDVIVIFAGYPDKMKTFLDKNEGLRSRIAFHLDFPDYNAGEMWQILKLMAEKKKFSLSDGIEEKCMGIFEEACSHEEFGNGRFARNLLEQAELRQSQRLIRDNRGKKISREKIMQLQPEDFETVAGNQYKEKKQGIGFAV